MLFRILLLFVIFSVALTQRDESSRVFKEKVRTSSNRVTTTIAPIQQDEQIDSRVVDDEIENLDNLASLAKVQRKQAESFRLWSSQFQIFKNNIWKFMNETNDVLRRNDKKIKTLQRVVRKIANDIDE